MHVCVCVCGWICTYDPPYRTWFEIDSERWEITVCLAAVCCSRIKSIEAIWLTHELCAARTKENWKLQFESLYFKQSVCLLRKFGHEWRWLSGRASEKVRRCAKQQQNGMSRREKSSTSNGTFFNMSTVFLLKYYAPCTTLCKQRDIL